MRCTMMDGYLEALTTGRLAYLCKGMPPRIPLGSRSWAPPFVETLQTRILHLATLAVDAKPLAPKGSVANNPFRLLPGRLVKEISQMRSITLREPTPSALAIKEAGLEFQRLQGRAWVYVRARNGTFCHPHRMRTSMLLVYAARR